MISSSLFLSFFASIFGVSPEFSSKSPPHFFQSFFFFFFWGRPISPVGLNTGFWRPIACGNTGFCRPISPFGLNTGFYRPISPVGLNTGSCHPGVALRLHRAVFWRPFRAYVSETPTGLLWIGVAFTPGVAGGYSRKPLRGL